MSTREKHERREDLFLEDFSSRKKRRKWRKYTQLKAAKVNRKWENRRKRGRGRRWGVGRVGERWRGKGGGRSGRRRMMETAWRVDGLGGRLQFIRRQSLDLVKCQILPQNLINGRWLRGRKKEWGREGGRRDGYAKVGKRATGPLYVTIIKSGLEIITADRGNEDFSC